MKDNTDNIKKQITAWIKWMYFMPISTVLFALTIYVLELSGLDTFVNVATFTWVLAISVWWVWALICIVNLAKLINVAVEELDTVKDEVKQIRKDII